MKVLRISNGVKTYTLGFRTEIETLIECGHTVVWAANFSDFRTSLDEIPCKIVNIPIRSNPFHKGNRVALKRICELISSEQIDAIYCSTPIGGTLARLAARHFPKVKVLYAAHGFLFFKGNNTFNNFIFKFHERFFARYTDCLITITEEDYLASQKLKLRGDSRYLIHGAGIDSSIPPLIDKNKIRLNNGIPLDTFVIISGGFLNKNKNNVVVIDSLKQLKSENVLYIVCGDGELKDSLQRRAVKNGVAEKVLFLGFRTDFQELLASSDCFVMPSFREGVPRSLLEAMRFGIPCVGSKTRGITELIIDGEGGYLCNPKKPSDFANSFMKIKNDYLGRKRMAKRNVEEAKKYTSEIVKRELREIINKELSN